MAKAAKIKQTDYTKGGRDISNTAIPLYQENLNLIGDYNRNQGVDTINDYLDLYWGNNAVQQSDFLRNYNRAMSGVTANNYGATSGGYTSSGQRAYDDQQRYQNDLAARLQSQGVNYASDMAQNYYNGLINANTSYNNAYQLGKAYSDTDQYNDLVDQQNGNWVSNLMSSAGTALMSSGNPYAMAAGAALGTAGNMMGVDTSGAMARIGGGNAGAGAANQYVNQNASNYSLGQNWGKAGVALWDKWFGNSGANTSAGSQIGSAVGRNVEQDVVSKILGG